MEKPKTDIKEGNREKGKWGSGAGKENTQGQCEIVKRERLVRENYVWEKAEGTGRRCPFPLPSLHEWMEAELGRQWQRSAPFPLRSGGKCVLETPSSANLGGREGV